MTKPFLKWVGGKSKLLPQLTRLLPSNISSLRHVELFTGGAALFFSRQPDKALLTDSNQHLITTYEAVRDFLEVVEEHLVDLETSHRESEDFYYRARKYFNQAQMTKAERAACFIYLNKTCFNGVYRVNRAGHFNVPKGQYAPDKQVLDFETLRAARDALRGAVLRHSDFEATAEDLGEGDFVYLDPPYVPVSKTANFTNYTQGGFSWDDQLRLRTCFGQMHKRRCKLLLSNSDTPEIRALYSDFTLEVVQAPRSVNRDSSKRGEVNELTIRNY